MLSVKNLVKQFGKNTAVADVSFGIKSGEIFALIGPNGSGKTTIIKIIAGLIRSTRGEVSVGGHDAAKNPIAAKAQLGYIPDDPMVWPAITGGEFLNFVGALYGVDEKTRSERMPKLLSLFGLEGISNEYFEDYSRGNKQKFTILAALLHKPKLLLVDEPIVGLDPTSADTAKQLFSDFAKEGGTILVATHTLPVAQEIANRIGVLKEGRLVAVGTMEELRAISGVHSDATLEDVYKALT